MATAPAPSVATQARMYCAPNGGQSCSDGYRRDESPTALQSWEIGREAVYADSSRELECQALLYFFPAGARRLSSSDQLSMTFNSLGLVSVSSCLIITKCWPSGATS